MNLQSVIQDLTAAREEALATAGVLAEALSVLRRGTPVEIAHRSEAAKPKSTAKAKLLRAPKKEKAPAKAKATKKAKVDDDESIARRGHMPKVGVQQLYCATLRERQDATGKLKVDGYRRVGPGEPLTAGTYDVRPSGDEDNTCVVLWRVKAERPEAAA